TRSAPDASMNTPTGLSNCASGPTPSAAPFADEPATVSTMTSGAGVTIGGSRRVDGSLASGPVAASATSSPPSAPALPTPFRARQPNTNASAPVATSWMYLVSTMDHG